VTQLVVVVTAEKMSRVPSQSHELQTVSDARAVGERERVGVEPGTTKDHRRTGSGRSALWATTPFRASPPASHAVWGSVSSIWFYGTGIRL